MCRMFVTACHTREPRLLFENYSAGLRGIYNSTICYDFGAYAHSCHSYAVGYIVSDVRLLKNVSVEKT